MQSIKIVWAVMSMISAIIAVAAWVHVVTFFLWVGNGLLKFVSDHTEDFE